MADNTTNNPPYDPLRPWVKTLDYEDGREVPYSKVWDVQDEDKHHQASFRILSTSGRVVDIDPTPAVFAEIFFPDLLLDDFVKHTNAYATRRLPPVSLQDVSRAELLRFFAIYYYMGIVKLPNKRDYWKGGTDDLWPSHYPCLKLNRTRFEYIWRNLHLVKPTNDMPLDDTNGEDEDLDPEETGTENEEDLTGTADDFSDTMVDIDGTGEEPVEHDTHWYAKAAPFIEHVNTTSKRLCERPGSCCAIDEMMKRFKGRSSQTARMKNKPIKEGYKFFAICDSLTGFVFDMVPNGRFDKASTHDIVVLLAAVLPEKGRYNYVIAMDNYFTWKRVVKSLTEMSIGVVGTARAARGWPPKEIKSIEDDRFNTLYLLNDDGGYRIGRWVDNNNVLMVTNVHDGTESIKRRRKKPRTTNVNRHHLETVWGEDYVKEIEIPRIIDDYNHWMLGVDKADQFIAYYRPNVRCRRTWMPLLFHSLDVVRVNAYIAATELGWKVQQQRSGRAIHKAFVAEMIKALLARADTFEIRSTRRRLQIQQTPSPTSKRARTSTKNPSLPDHRFLGDASGHIRVDAGKQNVCRMCSYLHYKAKAEGVTPLPPIRRPGKWCLACKDHLCVAHMNPYHGWGG